MPTPAGSSAQILPLERVPALIAGTVDRYAAEARCSAVLVESGLPAYKGTVSDSVRNCTAYVAAQIIVELHSRGYAAAEQTTQPSGFTPDIVVHFALVEIAGSENIYLSFWIVAYENYLREGAFKNQLHNTTILCTGHRILCTANAPKVPPTDGTLTDTVSRGAPGLPPK